MRAKAIILIGFLMYSLLLLIAPPMLRTVGIGPVQLPKRVLDILQVTLGLFAVWGLAMPWLILFGPASLKGTYARAAERQLWSFVRVSAGLALVLYGYIYIFTSTIYGFVLYLCGMPIHMFYLFAGSSMAMGLAWGLYTMRTAARRVG